MKMAQYLLKHRFSQQLQHLLLLQQIESKGNFMTQTFIVTITTIQSFTQEHTHVCAVLPYLKHLIQLTHFNS